MGKRAKMGNSSKISKRNRILAAALGFVATTGACGAFGTFATFENRALFGDETSSTSATGGRQIVVEPKGGELAKPSGRKAFLVAADNYGSRAAALPGAKNDVEALAERLEELGFDVVVLKTNDDYENLPQKSVIEAEFDEFVSRLRKGDFALVFLSGHGIQKTSTGEAFFAPIDVKTESAERLFETSVSIRDMMSKLEKSAATFRWTIVDACREDPTQTGSESAFETATTERSFAGAAKSLGRVSDVPQALALLQSCQPNKFSYEGPVGADGKRRGFFTTSLLEALDRQNPRADANGDGALSFYELSEYVSRRTNELAEASGKEQKPNLSGSIVNFALMTDLLKDGLPLSKWNEANGLYREACVFRAQRKWREALAKIKKAREINEKRQEYATAESEIQAQVDATAASETRAKADKLAEEAWASFDLGGETNVEEAIRLMKESLELVDLGANRRALKTFEDELEALRNPTPSTPSQPTSGHASALAAADAGGRTASTGGTSSGSASAPRWNGVEYVAVDESESEPSSASSSNGSALNPTHRYARNNGQTSAPTGGSSSGSRLVGMGPSGSRPSSGTSSPSTGRTSTQTGGSSSGGTSTGTSANGDWAGTHAAGAAKSLTIKEIEYKFHYCPAGSFTMGSPSSESGRYDDETQHRVELTNGFWMLETEVTQAMWKSLMGSNPSYFSSSGGGSSKVSGMDTSNFPVEEVSWNDCQEFIAKLNSLGVAPSGFQFRLPTEAEWEYACRAGTTSPYFWGSSLNGDKANCDGNYPNGTYTKGQYLERTTEVGSYDPNRWGLYDMHGNVWEWCEDTYAAYDTSNNVQNPINVTMGSSRVVRGGGWDDGAEGCRSAKRFISDPTRRGYYCGLRLALVRPSSRSK